MAQLIGLARIGRDAELRTVGNESVCNLSLCFTRWDSKTKERVAQWVDGSLWGKRAETLAQYLVKGAQVMVTLDDPHIQEFEGKNGTGHKLVGRVSQIELAGGRGDSAPAQAPSHRAPATAPAPATRNGYADAKTGRAAPVPSTGTGTGFDDMKDDPPF